MVTAAIGPHAGRTLRQGDGCNLPAARRRPQVPFPGERERRRQQGRAGHERAVACYRALVRRGERACHTAHQRTHGTWLPGRTTAVRSGGGGHSGGRRALPGGVSPAGNWLARASDATGRAGAYGVAVAPDGGWEPQEDPVGIAIWWRPWTRWVTRMRNASLPSSGAAPLPLASWTPVGMEPFRPFRFFSVQSAGSSPPPPFRPPTELTPTSFTSAVVLSLAVSLLAPAASLVTPSVSLDASPPLQLRSYRLPCCPRRRLGACRRRPYLLRRRKADCLRCQMRRKVLAWLTLRCPCRPCRRRLLTALGRRRRFSCRLPPVVQGAMPPLRAGDGEAPTSPLPPQSARPPPPLPPELPRIPLRRPWQAGSIRNRATSRMPLTSLGLRSRVHVGCLVPTADNYNPSATHYTVRLRALGCTTSVRKRIVRLHARAGNELGLR